MELTFYRTVSRLINSKSLYLALKLTAILILLQGQSALSMSCSTSIKTDSDQESDAKTESDLALRMYPEYKGPQNHLVDNYLRNPGLQRSPKYLNVISKGKIYPWEAVIQLMGLPLGTAAIKTDLEDFIDESEPMWKTTVRSSFSRRNQNNKVHFAAWLKFQYPELAKAVQEWSAECTDQGNATRPVKPEVLTKWVQKHPEYKEGMLVVARPALWNRIGILKNSNSRELAVNATAAVEEAQEFYIETVAALFDPVLAESHYPDLRKMLVRLAGPHYHRLSQPGVVRKIAQWVLTQYPELKPIAEGKLSNLTPDQLTDLFGQSLGVIPVEWITGDISKILSSNVALAELPAYWNENVFGRIMDFIHGDATPQIAAKTFLLKDPKTGQRRKPKTGDVVHLVTKWNDRTEGDGNKFDETGIKGIIESVIENQGSVVGLNLQLRTFDNTVLLPNLTDRTSEKIHTFWLEDLDMKDSRILKSAESESPLVLNYENMEFPEDSGEVMLPFRSSYLQVPISVGDELHLSMYGSRGLSHSWSINLIVTGFERDDRGRVTKLLGYNEEDMDFMFSQAKEIVRGRDGTPTQLIFEKGIYTFSPSTITAIPLATINRFDDSTRFTSPPASPIRAPLVAGKSWYRSDSHNTYVREDSGDYMLPIGADFQTRAEKGEAFEAPLTPGDVVSIRFSQKNKERAAGITKVWITKILRENDKAIGIRGYDILSVVEQDWFFTEIDSAISYIDIHTSFRGLANQIPGALDKKRPYTARPSSSGGFNWERVKSAFHGWEQSEKSQNQAGPREDIFGYQHFSDYRQIQLTPWEGKPLPYEKWLESNRIAENSESKVIWAYWVIQVTPESSGEEIHQAYRKLAIKFHPDRNGGDTSSMSSVNSAKQLLDAHHRN